MRITGTVPTALPLLPLLLFLSVRSCHLMLSLTTVNAISPLAEYPYHLCNTWGSSAHGCRPHSCHLHSSSSSSAFLKQRITPQAGQHTTFPAAVTYTSLVPIPTSHHSLCTPTVPLTFHIHSEFTSTQRPLHCAYFPPVTCSPPPLHASNPDFYFTPLPDTRLLRATAAPWASCLALFRTCDSERSRPRICTRH